MQGTRRFENTWLSGLWLPLVMGLAIAALPFAVARAAAPGEPISAIEQEVVDLVNAERAKVGAAPLTVNYSLMEAAWSHNEHMVATGCFSHNRCGNGDPGDRIKKTGYQAVTWGENIAKGQRTPAAVMTAWMNSSGHRRNILNSKFTDIGVAHNANGPTWTQVFGTPRPDYATVTPPAGGPDEPDPPVACELPEDLNGDKRVNRLDIDLVTERFLQTASQPSWEPRFDLHTDGVINLFDIFQVVTKLGAACP